MPGPAQLAGGLLFPGMPPPLRLGAPPAQILSALNDNLGVDPGTRALVLALDSGWEITQVADAILDGRLSLDGSVQAPGGGLLPKEGTPLGNFLDAIRNFFRTPPQDSLDAFIDALTESTEDVELNPTRVAAAADSMLRLEASGYPLAQVIEHIPGGFVFHVPGESTALFDRGGAFVCPSVPTGEIDCADLTDEWADVAADVLPEGVVDDPSPDDGLDDTGPDDTGPDSTGPLAFPGEVCAVGTVALVTDLEGATVVENDFGVCFSESGGSVSGSFDLVLDVVDENCAGIIELSGTLTGEYTPPDIGGPADVAASLEVTRGECLFFDEETVATAFLETTWTGNVTTVLVATLIDEDGTEALRFEGTIF